MDARCQLAGFLERALLTDSDELHEQLECSGTCHGLCLSIHEEDYIGKQGFLLIARARYERCRVVEEGRAVGVAV